LVKFRYKFITLLFTWTNIRCWGSKIW